MLKACVASWEQEQLHLCFPFHNPGARPAVAQRRAASRPRLSALTNEVCGIAVPFLSLHEPPTPRAQPVPGAQRSRRYRLLQAHQHFILWIYCRQTGGRRSATARLTWEEAETADVCGAMPIPVLQPLAHRTDFSSSVPGRWYCRCFGGG